MLIHPEINRSRKEKKSNTVRMVTLSKIKPAGVLATAKVKLREVV
jgi:hypothetical protein